MDLYIIIPLECAVTTTGEMNAKIESLNQYAILDENGLFAENLANRDICAKQLLCSYFRYHPAGEHHINKSEFFEYITNKLENCHEVFHTSPQENNFNDDNSDIVPTLISALSVANFMTLGL